MKFGRFCFVLVLVLLAQFTIAQLTYKELRVEYDSAWTFKNLQVIPIRYKPVDAGSSATAIPATKPITFSEALQKHKIKLQEMQYDKGADVNWLQVTNKSKETVMVQSGEIVAGGKQDRMMGETKFIAPGTTDYLHVYCVEKRRWDDKPKEFKYRGIANSEVRKAMDITSRQSDVWKEIDQQFAKQKTTSETWSYLQLYPNSVNTDTSYINYFTSRYYQGGATYAGFIFITADHVISTELFSSPALVQIAFTNMFNSYIQTVIANGSTPAVALNNVKSFMDKVMLSEETQKAYVNAHGKIHKSEGKVIHLVAYP